MDVLLSGVSLSDDLQEDFVECNCVLWRARGICKEGVLGRRSKATEKAMYDSCKLEIRDRLRVLHALLEPTMNVPGLKEDFADNLGVPPSKEFSCRLEEIALEQSWGVPRVLLSFEAVGWISVRSGLCVCVLFLVATTNKRQVQ